MTQGTCSVYLQCNYICVTDDSTLHLHLRTQESYWIRIGLGVLTTASRSGSFTCALHGKVLSSICPESCTVYHWMTPGSNLLRGGESSPHHVYRNSINLQSYHFFSKQKSPKPWNLLIHRFFLQGDRWKDFFCVNYFCSISSAILPSLLRWFLCTMTLPVLENALFSHP